MEFLASLAIKALFGTSICGTITVGTIYKCDRTLLGFEPLATNTNTGTSSKKVTPTPVSGDVVVGLVPTVSNNLSVAGEKSVTNETTTLASGNLNDGGAVKGVDELTPQPIQEEVKADQPKVESINVDSTSSTLSGGATVDTSEKAVGTVVPTAPTTTTTEVKEKVESEPKVETSIEGDVSTISSTSGQSEKDVVSVINPQVAESEPSTTQENTLDSGSITGQAG